MLQEATKALNSAFNNSFIKKLSQYLHDCVREEVKSSTFRNLKGDKDNKWIFLPGEEELFTQNKEYISLDGKDSKLTELMLQSELGSKDKYLIYGYLFLVGKSNKSKRQNEFLTPLLYMPCKLERNGVNINCLPLDEVLSLNTGALAALMRKSDDEDETDIMLEGLLDVVPELPITEEKLNIFLTTLKSLVPEVEISYNKSDYETEDNISKTDEKNFYKEKIDGENIEDVIEHEEQHLSLSDTQQQVIKNIDNTKFVAVQGPPGTGKSQTIVNLVAHLVANGKTVLVASRMDKAVDVVAERLNQLGASHMALRAGRLNYQRSLSNELNALIAEHSSLDKNFEDALFADTDDMKTHLNILRDTENKCEQIIKLEKLWHDKALDTEEERSLHPAPVFIRRNLKKSEVETIRNTIKTLRENIQKSGIFSKFTNFTTLSQLKKILEMKDFDATPQNLSKLAEELQLAAKICDMNSVEEQIQALGNLHIMSEQIRQMKKKQPKLAVNILKNKRREALRALLRDENKCRRLKIHAKSLISNRKRQQTNILEEEDFKPLLEAFPCWCVTTYAVSDSLPLKPGMFDVAIIDEASQCDIASCFPILFRAKRAVIVGDDKQLPHLSFLEKAKEQSFLSQYGIPDKYQLIWRFRTNSMFDLADYYSINSVMLDEHFRSLPPIINFSNHEFYNDRIRVMRKDKSDDLVLELEEVKDGKVDADATRNLPEIEAVVKRVHEIVIEDERKNPDNPVSIGIISPFRAQVEQLKVSLSKVLSDHMIKKHQIEIGTAHTFQGDERDIMLISWAIANNSFPQSLIFLQKPNLFNVAVTRARNKVINFISKDPTELPEGHFRNYINFLKHYQNMRQAMLSGDIAENTYKNELEQIIASQIRERGYKVQAGAEIAGLSADLLVDDKIVIEVDGMDDKISSTMPSMKKQAILERCGFKVNRITFREWQYSPNACLDRVLRELNPEK